MDLNAEKLEDKLQEYGYDPSKKTLFTLEGLIMYLNPKIVHGLLSFIARRSGKDNAVAFDYSRSYSGTTSDKYLKESMATRKFVESQGGDTGRYAVVGPVEKLLAEMGFWNTWNMTDKDYKKAYFKGKNAHRNVSSLLWFAYGKV